MHQQNLVKKLYIYKQIFKEKVLGFKLFEK